MKTKVIALAVILLALFTVLSGCSQTQEEYEAELAENKVEVTAALSELQKTMLNEQTFEVKFVMKSRRYPYVNRDGWLKEFESNGETVKCEWEEIDVAVTVVYDSGSWYQKETMGNVTLESRFDAKTATYERSGEIAVVGAEAHKYDNYVARAFTEYGRIDDTVTALENEKRFSKRLYQIQKMQVDVIDGNAPYVTGFAEETKYVWENVRSMRSDKCAYIAKKGKIEQIEFTTELIMVYEKEKSVINAEKVLVADVYSSANGVMSFVYDDVTLPPRTAA